LLTTCFCRDRHW